MYQVPVPGINLVISLKGFFKHLKNTKLGKSSSATRVARCTCRQASPSAVTPSFPFWLTRMSVRLSSIDTTWRHTHYSTCKKTATDPISDKRHNVSNVISDNRS